MVTNISRQSAVAPFFIAIINTIITFALLNRDTQAPAKLRLGWHFELSLLAGAGLEQGPPRNAGFNWRHAVRCEQHPVTVQALRAVLGTSRPGIPYEHAQEAKGQNVCK